jgi:chemotaxis protein CheD
MYEYYDNRLKNKIINLAPGDYFATDKDLLINTVLGSCVSVVLYDPLLKAGGMNHFMLAEMKAKSNIDNYFKEERYGLYAMEALINDLLKLGSKKGNLKAKIFGGSNVIQTARTIEIGQENIRFAEEFLKTENIPIVNRDTGGKKARKIYLYAKSFKILLKRVNIRTTDLDQQMINYQKELEKKKDGGTTILF